MSARMLDAYIGTADGVRRLRDGRLEPLGLEGERIMAIHAWRDGPDVRLLAGTYGNGLYRSTRDEWSRVDAGLTATAFRFLAPDPGQGETIVAGTEPARLFRSANGGKSWSELEGVTRIEGHERWFLPYSPRAGAVRNVYSPPGRTDRLLASVEVGGLLASDDRGRSWTCRPIGGDEDIHHITGHPDDPELLFAATGTASLTRRAPGEPRPGGVARSRDGGRRWEKLETDYTRAIIVPPTRPDLLVAGPARTVGQGGRIVVSGDRGDTWQPAGDGIEVPMPDMVELFVAAPDGEIWAICARGRLLRTTAGEWSWRSALPSGAPNDVQSVSFLPRAA